MSEPSLKPQVSPLVTHRKLEDCALLHHEGYETLLRVNFDALPLIEAMDGSRSLEDLEDLLMAQRGTLAYHELVTLLYQLWDHGMLENEDEVQSVLFPHHESRSLDRVLNWRTAKGLLWAKYMSKGVGRALAFTAPFADALSSTPLLIVQALLGVMGLALYGAGIANWPDNLFAFHESWAVGIVLSWTGLALFLTVRGLVRASLLEAKGPGIPRAGVRWVCGVVYLDVDDREVAHLNQDMRKRFALAGLLTPLALATFAELIRLAGGPDWLEVWSAVGMLLVFLDICPFFPTDGSRLLELITAVDDQHRRVRSFMVRKLIRGFFHGHDDPETTRLAVASTMWIIWFFGAIHLFTTDIISHLLALETALFHMESVPELIVSGAFFLYVVVILSVVVVTGVSALLSFAFQAVTPQGKDAPRQAHQASELSESDRAELQQDLEQLPLTRSLPQEAIEALLEHMEQHRFHAGDWIYRGDPDDRRFYWVLSGAVALHNPLPEGGTKLVAQLSHGQHLGEEALSDKPHTYYAQSVDESVLICLDGNHLRSLLDDDHPHTEELKSVLSVAHFLDGIPELAGLGPGGRLDLASELKQRQMEAGEVVVTQGEEADSMFFIREGSVRVVRTNQAGSAEQLANLTIGEAFGEMGLLFSKPRSATVSCTENSLLVEVPKHALQRALKNSFHVGLALETLATGRLETSS